MHQKNRNEKGFTLIEVVVTLVLVGITAALAGMWIVNVASGYVFAKTNAETVQKGQLAMTRLARELSALQTVTASSGSGITFDRSNTMDVSGSPTTATITISQSGGQLLLNGSPLTNRVNGFTLRYCSTADSMVPCTAENWSSSSRIIEITLTLAGADNTPSSFTRRVAPRNL